jgi:hypothetical protein
MVLTADDTTDWPTVLVEAPKAPVSGVKLATNDAAPLPVGVHVNVARELVDAPTGLTALVAMMFCDGKERRVMVPVGAIPPAAAVTVARTVTAVLA